MKQYYVIEKDDRDWDLDSEIPYNSHEEAVEVKKRYEEDYPGTTYVIWEVD